MKKQATKKEKELSTRICKHGLTTGFCAYCNPETETEPETESSNNDTTPKPETMTTEVWELLNSKPKTEPEPETVTMQAYKIILDSINKSRKRVDKVVRGTLVEKVSKETYLETKPTWEPLELVNETMIKVLENRVSPWCFESPENLVRYLRGAVRKRLITIQQELIEQPISFYESPETLSVPDLSNELSTFKKDLFEMVLNAKRKNDKPLLNAKEKELFIAFYETGETPKEIATRTGENYDSIRVEISRINKKMGTLPLKDYFNACIVSPNPTYFPKHSTDTSDIRVCNISPLKRFRITKETKDLELFRVESLEHLKYQKKHNAGTIKTLATSDYRQPEPHKTPWVDYDSKTIWDLWNCSPVFNKWVSTGRNAGFVMETYSTLWVEKRNRKTLAFKRQPLVERVAFRGKEFNRTRNQLNPDKKPYTKKDKIKRLSTLALNRGNIPYYRTLQTYLSTLI